MARKNKLQEAGAEVFDSLFSVGPEKAPETSQAESSREPEKTAQGADKKPKKNKENTTPKIVVQGDYVVDKHVGNEVNGVASGATGINVSKEEK